MAKLWKKLPPLMADNFGFIEVMNKTDGMGIIDDCSEYRTSAQRQRRHRGNGGAQMRVVHTEISSEDVVTGTRQKVLDTFSQCRQEFSPEFVLLSAGPCSAMIGTDLGEIAENIEQESGIKTAAIKLSGHKTYDVGISETLLSMAKLLTGPGEMRESGINILGATSLDWQEENAGSLRGWLEKEGFHVTANFGGTEKAENIAKAAEASVNLVATVSGLAAAKYLKSEYGTPYIAAAPFGKTWTSRVLAALQSQTQPESSAQAGNQQAESGMQAGNRQAESGMQPGNRQAENGVQPEVLIIGEQFMGNAIRETLVSDYGMKNVQVCTFYTLEKSLAQPGDRRIRSEQEAQKLLREGGFHTIIADGMLRCFAPECSRWIDLPHKAFQLYGEHPALPLFLGENLNKWLDEWLKKG